MSFEPFRLPLQRLALGLAAGVGSALLARPLGPQASVAAGALALIWLWLSAAAPRSSLLRAVAACLAPLLLVALNLALWSTLGLPAPLASGALNAALFVAVVFLVRKEDAASSTLAWLFALLGPPAAAVWWSPEASLAGAPFLAGCVLVLWIRGLHGAALAAFPGPETTAAAAVQLSLSLLLHAVLTSGPHPPLTIVALILLAAALVLGFWQSGQASEAVAAGRRRPVRSTLPALLLAAVFGSGVFAWWHFSGPLIEAWTVAAMESGRDEPAARTDPALRRPPENNPAREAKKAMPPAPVPRASVPAAPLGTRAATTADPGLGPIAPPEPNASSPPPSRFRSETRTTPPGAARVASSQPAFVSGSDDHPEFSGPEATFPRERRAQSGGTLVTHATTTPATRAAPTTVPAAPSKAAASGTTAGRSTAPRPPEDGAPAGPGPESQPLAEEVPEPAAEAAARSEPMAETEPASEPEPAPPATKAGPASGSSVSESGLALDLDWVPDPMVVDLTAPTVPGLADGELAYPDAQTVAIDPLAASIGFLAVPEGERVPERVYLRAMVYERVGPDGFLPAEPRSVHRTPPAAKAPAPLRLEPPRASEDEWILRMGPAATSALPLPTHFAEIAVTAAESIQWDPARRTARVVGPRALRDVRFRHPGFESRFPASPRPDLEAASLQLYGDPRVNERLRDLSLRWTGRPDRSPEQFVARVQDRLQARSRYALRTRIPAGWEPALLRWVESGSEGFCVHFAGAFVLLARAYGIPARVVSGYLLTDFDRQARQFPIHPWNAHAWVEILEDGHWRRIDPTPSSRLFRGLPRSPEASFAAFPEPVEAAPEAPATNLSESTASAPTDPDTIAEETSADGMPETASPGEPERRQPPEPPPGRLTASVAESLEPAEAPSRAAFPSAPPAGETGPAPGVLLSAVPPSSASPPPDEAPVAALSSASTSFPAGDPAPAPTRTGLPSASSPAGLDSTPSATPGAASTDPEEARSRRFLWIFPLGALIALLLAVAFRRAARGHRAFPGEDADLRAEDDCRERAGYLLGELERRQAALPDPTRSEAAAHLHGRLLRLRYGPGASRRELAAAEALWRELRPGSLSTRNVSE